MLEGWKHEDGSVSRLADEDLQRCLDGARELACHSAKATTSAFSPDPTCSNTRYSCSAQGLIRLLLLNVLGSTRWLHSPLHACTDILVEKAHAQRMCSTCRGTLKSRVEAERQGLWSHLPSIFNLEADLPNWGPG